MKKAKRISSQSNKNINDMKMALTLKRSNGAGRAQTPGTAALSSRIVTTSFFFFCIVIKQQNAS